MLFIFFCWNIASNLVMKWTASYQGFCSFIIILTLCFKFNWWPFASISQRCTLIARFMGQHGAHLGWKDPGGSHVGPINFATWVIFIFSEKHFIIFDTAEMATHPWYIFKKTKGHCRHCWNAPACILSVVYTKAYLHQHPHWDVIAVGFLPAFTQEAMKYFTTIVGHTVLNPKKYVPICYCYIIMIYLVMKTNTPSLS